MSVTRVLCDEMKEPTADILTPYERAIALPTLVIGRRPLPRKICSKSDPPPVKSADFDQYLLITS